MLKFKNKILNIITIIPVVIDLIEYVIKVYNDSIKAVINNKSEKK